jgi:sec-independent protein translocase protein TatB
MTGVDSSEIILLLIIGLIVLGPKRLPEIANKVGTWIGHARRMTRSLKRQLEDELRIEETTNSIRSAMNPRPETSEMPTPVKVDEEPDAHVPSDDDTYSPLHQDDANDGKSA